MIMDHKAFYKLVVALRNKQKEYFKTRSQSALRERRLLKSVSMTKLKEWKIY